MLILSGIAVIIYGLGPNWDGIIGKEWLTKLKDMIK